MLTGRKLVVAGGDARMLEVIRCICDEGAHVTVVGFDAVPHPMPEVIHVRAISETFALADAVIFPMAGIDDDGKLDARFSGRAIRVSDHDLASIRPGTPVFTGIARSRFESVCRRLDLRLIKLMDLDDVAILNSIPTAEGTIAMAMDFMDITIHGCQAVVVGFGRCGFTLARSLRALGASVSVAARRPSDLARMVEMGFAPVKMDDLGSAVQNADLVVNTVPHAILTAPIIDVMPTSCVVIDIASKPGGTDFEHAANRGVHATLAPSLPGAVAPKTAGRILASTICRILNDIVHD